MDALPRRAEEGGPFALLDPMTAVNQRLVLARALRRLYCDRGGVASGKEGDEKVEGSGESDLEAEATATAEEARRAAAVVLGARHPLLRSVCTEWGLPPPDEAEMEPCDGACLGKRSRESAKQT